ncbi:8158_t:CDS:2, partial [Cetraspora pellucida]
TNSNITSKTNDNNTSNINKSDAPKTNDSNVSETNESRGYSNYDEYDDYYEQDLEEIRNPFYNNVQWCLSYSDSIKGLSNEGPF